MVERYCEGCDRLLVRRATESRMPWLLRRYCGKNCAVRNQPRPRRARRPFAMSRLVEATEGASLAEIAERSGVPRTTLEGWARSDRGLTPFEADLLACAFQIHPAFVWSMWWEEAWLRDARDMRRARIETKADRIFRRHGKRLGAAA